MNTENTASQPKETPEESIGDDAEFIHLLESYRQYPSIKRVRDITTYLDSKLRAPADQTASVVVPEGYVVMPARLTAANGAKGLLSGEFSESVQVSCPDCRDEGDDFECHACENFGTTEQRVAVTWDTIKSIYEMAVENIAVPAPQQSLAPAADNDDSLNICLSDLENSSIYDNPREMAECMKAVIKRIRALPVVAAEGQVSAAAPADGNPTTIHFLRACDKYEKYSEADNPELGMRKAFEFLKACASEGQAQTSAAVRDAALEEAALVCDGYNDGTAEYPDFEGGMEAGAEMCAQDIRALKLTAQSADKPTGQKS